MQASFLVPVQPGGELPCEQQGVEDGLEVAPFPSFDMWDLGQSILASLLRTFLS